MKTIAIISRHAVPNYGSLMQAYALQKAVNNLGCSAFYIDAEFCYWSPKAIANAAMTTSKYNKIPILNFISYWIKYYRYKAPIRLFREYQIKWLNLSEKRYLKKKELDDSPPIADVYLVGSDQVWNVMPDGKLEYAYFLDFVDDRRKKYAYAASFGSIEKIKDQLMNIQRYLSEFSEITVREKNAVKILNKMGLVGKQVLDPTLLLGVSEWNQIASKLNLSEYILLYQVNHNKELCHFAQKIASKLDIRLIRISNDLSEKNWGKEFFYLPKPDDWLALFRNAKYVITDSFHGTCFCLQYHKQFIDILPEYHYQRILSILELVGLEQRITSSGEDYKILFEPIDWEKVDSIIKVEREKSISSLREMVER